ncbi:MAG TPA: IclR family transcriptional regulator [Bosea sp. (in: a-proteobacteria)]|jgi:DNA-binding IclR family transcriptional regulator|uniref:IclR family transcriptional regulator n=1 Tax=Bosea sp. (in: a-proteobacteria) TaxID=1871050 RepID=UPI002E15F59A|nr:IclR family transcriptional regulator [Bosea sp. (in: a-proteobacteria)]
MEQLHAEPSSRPGPYPAPALEKGLEIIELLAAAQKPLSTRAIAESLGRSKGEIFRMLFVLVERGYLNRDPATEELTLSNRLFELGMRTPRARQLVEVAAPAMERLSEKTAQSAHLVVLNEGETVVIANAAGTGDISFTLRLGYRRPAHDATSGRVILAFQDGEARERSLQPAQLAGGLEYPGFWAMLDEIAARGFLVAESHDMPGVTDISAPILDRQGRAVASIVIPYLNRRSARTRHDEVLAELLATCRAISAELG